MTTGAGGRRRLAVLGSPIAHSRSPQLHTAAYRVLGLDWEYERIEVREGGLADLIGGLGPQWRGLSLTMPLKREALRVADAVDARAAELAQANTLVLSDAGVRAFSTDVDGVLGALASLGVGPVRSATVLGGGATAESAVAARRTLGAEGTVGVRTPARAARLGASARVLPLAEAPMDAAVVVSTVPAGAELPVRVPDRPGVLLDVVYDPWPTPLATAWRARGGRVANGLEMLLHQALGQVRAFVGGDPGIPLPDEDAVLRAMRDAAGWGAVEGS
ncbi:MAG: shikimate dehydrogenase [Micrococcales bacterium]|nr:shikimate dehydrogenase [Micrococcales bacterium]